MSRLTAIGAMFAEVARILQYQRHWLSVASFLISASRMLALVIAELARAARERAIMLGCMIATTFVVMHRYLSRPPSRWASA